MSRQGREHACGPYKHGKKFRIVYFGANGASETVSYTTEAAAIEERDAYNAAAGSRTVAEAVTEYLGQMEAKSVETARYRLTAILRLKEGDRPLTAINAPLARELYRRRTEEAAVDTHRSELGYVSRFCRWCVERGWIRVNPFDDVKPIGKRNKGKPKLRVNGTRQLLKTLLEDDSLEATAVLMALMLGLRANEVVKRTVADLDDDGRLLWIRDTKTAAGDREIEIPEVLRIRLLRHAAGKAPTDRIFGDATRYWLHYHTVRLCKDAGVERVTPHGLRGSGATTAVRLGGGVEQVAAALGHADDGATLKAHYLGGGALESARARTISALTENASDPLAHNEAPTHNRGIKHEPYETGSLVTGAENSLTNDPNTEVDELTTN